MLVLQYLAPHVITCVVLLFIGHSVVELRPPRPTPRRRKGRAYHNHGHE